jgi:hypothetical protein
MAKHLVTDNTNAPRPPGQTGISPTVDDCQTSLLDLPITSSPEAELTEDQVLSLLATTDLPTRFIEKISKNFRLMTSRKIRLGVIGHAGTPRHISVPMLRHLFTFELMRVGLTPGIAADIKRASDEILVSRLQTIPSGERLSLAKCASGRIAAELLLDTEPRMITAALENPRLTQALVSRALMRRHAPAALIQTVCHHAGWSLRREIRAALLHNENTPLASALEFANSFSPPQLREILSGSHLPSNVKSALLKHAEENK